MNKLKTLNIILLILVFSVNSFSQEEDVKKIREEYVKYNKLISDYESEGLSYFPPRFSIKTIQNRPALGPVNFDFTYYYDENTNIDEVDNPDLAKTWAIIRKVVYTEGMPSYQDYKEILYDEKGELLFYYSKLTGNTCGEKRFYFQNGKLIKIKFNPITHEDCSDDNDFPEFTRYAGKLTKDDIDWQKWILKDADDHKNTLLRLYDAI